MLKQKTYPYTKLITLFPTDELEFIPILAKLILAFTKANVVVKINIFNVCLKYFIDFYHKDFMSVSVLGWLKIFSGFSP